MTFIPTCIVVGIVGRISVRNKDKNLLCIASAVSKNLVCLNKSFFIVYSAHVIRTYRNLTYKGVSVTCPILIQMRITVNSHKRIVNIIFTTVKIIISYYVSKYTVN